MSVQVKLGRWLTRDGREAVIDREVSSEICGWRFTGAFAGEENKEPRLLWSSRGEFLPSSRVQHELDLIEYIGPLDPPPLDPRSLQPGDDYRCNDGTKGYLAGFSPKGYPVCWIDGGRWAEIYDDKALKYPAGPWVEPPKVHRCVLVVYEGKHDVIYTTTLRPEANWEYPNNVLDRVSVTWTEGKGFELGEVIKQ